MGVRGLLKNSSLRKKVVLTKTFALNKAFLHGCPGAAKEFAVEKESRVDKDFRS